MFAYCNNNPVSHEDSSGSTPSPSAFFAQAIPSGASADEEELAILNSNGISLYNGVPVIKLPFGGDVGFSAGFIFLGNGVKAESSGVATLKHEYGHAVHLSQIGWESYFVWVLIPSVVNYHRGVAYADYYSQPWEYIADVLGGVKRTNGEQPYTYESGTQKTAKEYYEFTLIYVGAYPN